MKAQRDFLVLGGPGHLQVIRLEDGQQTFEMQDEASKANPVQVFVYRIARVGAGSHPPIGFLVPAHIDGEQKHLSAWVFNKLVQALMSGHPMSGQVLLGLNFTVSDREPHVRTIRAETRAHPIGANGIVRLAPLATHDCNKMIDNRLFIELKDVRGFLEATVRDAAQRAFQPFIDRAVDQVLRNEKWKP